ncbi:MAG: ATP synthase F1 subunit epsilon [Defluviitaleaceae bacterium]|nr:ATP synthase F1 subunit epsilon [Defluviitaleaceae bacterium]
MADTPATTEEKKLEIRVISPTTATTKSPYLRVSADMVIMRCTTGDFGVLPGRVPCSMVLGNGVLRIMNDEDEKQMSILGGIAHVSDDIVTILSDSAQRPEDIDTNAVTTEQAEFQRLFDKAEDLNEKTSYRKDIRRCQVQLDVASTLKK